jgi:DNA-binding SARP family transcriptional activator
VLGHAHRVAGDSRAAQRTLAPLLGDDMDPLDPALAWRSAMAHYSLGDYAEALGVLDRSRPEPRPTPDGVSVDICRSAALARLGRGTDAARIAAAAVACAQRLGDDAVLGSAHATAAYTVTGDERELHLAQALAAAERCGDHPLRARILCSQADAHLTAAQYDAALATAEQAVEAAERGSPPGLLVASVSNLGEALRHTGRYDQAQLQLTRSVSLARGHGLRRTSSGLLGLADLHVARGRWHEAMAGYEQAADAARRVGEMQTLVPALCGLIRLLGHHAPGTADLGRAREARQELEAAATPAFTAQSVAAAGWLHLAGGDAEAATAAATQALGEARARGMAAVVAEALELLAAAAQDPGTARAALTEAEALWVAGGAEPAADRVRVLLGRLPGAAPDSQLRARTAARRLRRLGVMTVAGVPVDRPVADRSVSVRLLDGFEVLVDGTAVPVTAWRSRQARTLVKILAAHRGRLLRRGEICDLLWPDDDPARTGHRLSVLLSAVRGVLDPQREWPADHFVRGDHGGLALDLRHVEVDADRLLADAAHARDLVQAGQAEPALELLCEVAADTGEVLGDEPDASWADPLREEVRAATLGAVRQLARLRTRQGDHDGASILLNRLLTADPYDEPAHRALVRTLLRAGRHGEARRAFARWADAMREIDVPPPDPRTQLVLTR